MPRSRILKVANMSFKAIRENKILAKISEFTVRIASVSSDGSGESVHMHRLTRAFAACIHEQKM